MKEIKLRTIIVAVLRASMYLFMVGGLFLIIVLAFTKPAHAKPIYQDEYVTFYLIDTDSEVIKYECTKKYGFAPYLKEHTGCIIIAPDPDTYYWKNKIIVSVYSPGPGSSNWCHEIAHPYGWKHKDGPWENFAHPLFNKTPCGPGGVWR